MEMREACGRRLCGCLGRSAAAGESCSDYSKGEWKELEGYANSGKDGSRPCSGVPAHSRLFSKNVLHF
jgi:hypothetical protein